MFEKIDLTEFNENHTFYVDNNSIYSFMLDYIVLSEKSTYLTKSALSNYVVTFEAFYQFILNNLKNSNATSLIRNDTEMLKDVMYVRPFLKNLYKVGKMTNLNDSNKSKVINYLESLSMSKYDTFITLYAEYLKIMGILQIAYCRSILSNKHIPLLIKPTVEFTKFINNSTNFVGGELPLNGKFISIDEIKKTLTEDDYYYNIGGERGILLNNREGRLKEENKYINIESYIKSLRTIDAPDLEDAVDRVICNIIIIFKAHELCLERREILVIDYLNERN